MTGVIPSLDALKLQAKELRKSLNGEGREVRHGQALELIAKSHGFRDWNTLHAAVGNAPRPPVVVGQIVEGRYLGQEFVGEVLGVQVLSEGRYRVTFDFAEAVDVVTFDSFSNFRKRVSKTVDSTGRSFDRTSDGQPHIVLAM
ncbi:MAG: glyoxalase superfamily protein [Paracoccaceae bacterium]